MIGKQTTILDASEWTKGMSSGADLSDGGFSPETDAVNLIANPGVIYAPAIAVDKSTNLTGEAIAYTPGKSSSPVNGFILDSGGKIYSIDTNQALTASSALSGTYQTGTSDIANFNGKLFATSTTDVARMDTDLTNGNATWWSTTVTGSGSPFGILTSGVRHPLIEFIGYLWVADLNQLHRIDSSSAGVKGAFLLDSSNEMTALGLDSSASQMFIATTKAANYSGTISAGYRLFVYDGVSSTPSREIPVDAMITAFRNVGGLTYITYGQKLGYWNGNGITFLRKLNNITLLGANLAYKHHLSNIENTLYVVDGTQILAFGEILPGQKKFYYAFKNNINSNKFSMICNAGNNNLGMGFATTKFYIFDTTSVATTNGLTLYSNSYDFPRPVYMRGVYLEYATAIPNNDDNRALYYQSQDKSGFLPLSIEGQYGTSGLKNDSGASVYFIENVIGFVQTKMRSIKFRYSTFTVNSGLKRIILNWDVAE